MSEQVVCRICGNAYDADDPSHQCFMADHSAYTAMSEKEIIAEANMDKIIGLLGNILDKLTVIARKE